MQYSDESSECLSWNITNNKSYSYIKWVKQHIHSLDF